jgi:hypothetical protein
MLLAAGAVVLLVGRGGPDQIAVRAGADRLLTVHAERLAAHDSPTIVRSPTEPSRLVVAEKVDRPAFAAALHVSGDGGRSWDDVRFPTPAGEDRPYAPDLAWAPDGRLFMSFVTLQGKGNSPGAVWVTQSRSGGRTWAAPRRVVGPNAFQVRLAVDPEGGDLFLTWLQASDAAVGCANCFGAVRLPILASRSADGGRTWSAPAQVSRSKRLRVGAPVPAVLPDGRLVVLYYDFKGDRVDWENLRRGPYRGTFELVMSRSRRRGTSFEETVVEPRVVPRGRFLVYLPRFPALAADPERGTLYAAWPDARAGTRDILLRRSEDDGSSWSQPRRIGPASPGGQSLPRLAVAPGGRVDLAYLEGSGDDRGATTRARFATSFDQGRSWSSLALSSRVFDAAVGPEGAPGVTDQGTRVGLVSSDPDAFAVWTDARRGTPVTGKLDIFFAPVAIGGH